MMNRNIEPRPEYRSPNFETLGFVYPVVIPRSEDRRSRMQASTSGATVEEAVRETELLSSQMVPAAKFLQTGASKMPWPPGQSSADDEEKYDMEQPIPSIKEELQQHWTVTSVSNKRKPAEITPVHSRKIIKQVSSANNIGQFSSEIKVEHTNVTKHSQIMIGHSNYNLLENSENPMLPSDSTSTVSDNNKSEIMHQASNNDNMPSFQQVKPETVNVPLQSCVKSDPGDGPSNIMIYEMLLDMQQQIFDMQQRQVKLEQMFELQNINQKRRSSGKENSEPLSDILQSESNAQNTKESSVKDDHTLMPPPPPPPGISKSKQVNDSERRSEGGANSGSDAMRKSVTRRRLEFESPKTASASPSVCTVRVDTPANMKELILNIVTKKNSVAYGIDKIVLKPNSLT